MTPPPTADIGGVIAELQRQIEAQFDPDHGLTERDRLILIANLHADRLHADDLADIEEQAARAVSSALSHEQTRIEG